jgi:alpha-2-macroglobulin
MIARTRFLLVALGVGLVIAALGTNGPAAGAEVAPASGLALVARDAVAPAAPVVPAEVVAAMQQERYTEAEAALDRLTAKAKSADETAYYALIRGIAQRLDNRADAARRTLGDALKAAPKGAWTAKIRYELATLELASGHADDAEALVRELAEALLDGDRKDRLAEVDHAFARKLLKPDDPITAPDPNAAYELLSRARGLAKGASLRASLLYAMARASQAAGNHGRAIQDFQAYLKEYPKGADRTATRYHLGEAEWNVGQPLAAWRTWTDLARDLGNAKKPLDKDDDSFRARALYQIAQTYGILNPPDDTNLNLGVAALRRFLQAYPAHPWAVKAAYEIGASYLARGQSQPALEALNAFLKGDEFRAEGDEAKRDLAQLAMTVTFQIGQILQSQEKFVEAIAAWTGYLAQYPNGPQSADALRAILDTELRIADDHLRREQYDEARAAWQAFVAKNPLDGRVPEVLLPSQVVREAQSGATGTRPEPQAKPGPFPPETDAPVSGDEYPQEHRRKQQRFPRNPSASSGRRPAATGDTRHVPTRERQRSDRGTRRGRGQLSLSGRRLGPS